MKMRTVFVLVCSLMVVCVAGARETKKKTKSASKATQAQPVQPQQTHVTHPETHGGSPAGEPRFQQTKAPQHVLEPPTNPTRPAGVGTSVQPKELGATTAHAATVAQPAAPPLTKEQLDESYARSQGFHSAEQYRKWKETGQLEGLANHAFTKAVPQHFNLPSNLEPGMAGATFQQDRRIEGSRNWQSAKYSVFRDYRCAWHDRLWWESHHSHMVFVMGGWYYRNAGYWFPAWGYAPSAVYLYDGPIYAYSNLPPDQIVANLQAALQQLGYYHGIVNGRLDGLTRTAIADYQRDHDLYITSAIDEPTLASLAMV